MTSCTSNRKSAALFFFFMIILLNNFYQLHHFHLASDHDCAMTQEMVSSPAIEAKDNADPSVSFEHVFGMPVTGASRMTTIKHVHSPPREELWLLHQPSKSDEDHGSLQRIPRIINKMYFQKDGHFQEAPPLALSASKNKDNNEKKKKNGYHSSLDFVVGQSLRSAHLSWKMNNPNYHIRYYNLISARLYLRTNFHPVFLRTFDCIQAFSGKANFFRIAILYRDGGFHSDWKMVCLEYELLDRIANTTDFFVAMDIGNPHLKNLQRRRQPCAQNSFVGSIPRHPILAKYLKLAMNNVQRNYYPANENPLFLTGPCVLGKAVKAFKKDFGNDTLSWPIHEKNHYYWKGREITQGKCDLCGRGQSWSNGNNYNVLAKNRTYYCEDSASIFQE